MIFLMDIITDVEKCYSHGDLNTVTTGRFPMMLSLSIVLTIYFVLSYRPSRDIILIILDKVIDILPATSTFLFIFFIVWYLVSLFAH